MKKRSNNTFLFIVILILMVLAIFFLYATYGNSWLIFKGVPVISSIKDPLGGVIDSIAAFGDSLINMITGFFTK
jgi:hypothetical protein